MKSNISTKITFAAVGLVLITAVSVGFAVYSGSNAILVKHETENLGDHTKIISTHLNSRIKSLTQDVRFLAGTPPIQGLVRSQKTVTNIDPVDGSTTQLWRNRLATIFVQFLRTKPDYQQIRFIGLAEGGREIVRVERKQDGSIHVSNKIELQQKGQRRYFIDTIKLDADQLYISEVTLNREHDQVTTPWIAVMRAAVPIYSKQGDLFGLVIINMDFHSILKTIIYDQHYKKHTKLYITNDKGDYLLHPNPSHSFSFEFGLQYRLQNDYPLLASEFEKNTPSKLDNDINLTLANEFLHFHKTNFDSLHQDRFIGLALTASYQDVTSNSIVVRNHSALIVILLITFGGGLAWFFSRHLTQPLNKITEAAKSIATGQYDVSLPLDAGGELGLLAKGFDHMTQQISERDTALKKRTNELVILNDELKDEVVKRQINAKLLVEANSRFEQFANNTTHVIWLIDIETKQIIYVNPAFEKIWQEKAQQLYIEPLLWQKKIHPEDVYNVQQSFETAIKGDTNQYDTEYRITKSNGEIVWIHDHGVPIFDESGVMKKYAGIAEDITLRKSAEQALQNSEENYRQIVETTNEGIIVIDPITNIQFINTKISKLLGFSSENLMNSPIQNYIVHDNYIEIEHLFKIPSNEPRRIEATFIDKSKNKLNTKICITSIFSGVDNNVYKGSLILVTDMTHEILAAEEHHALQQQLQQSQKMESIGQLTGGIAHDFNNILSSVIGFTELSLEQNNNTDDLLSDYLSEVLIAGERAQELVQQMLTFSRGTAGELKPLSLSPLIKEAIKLLRPTIPASLIIKVDIDSNIPKIKADVVQIHQLLMNLCINARDAMSGIGNLTITFYKQTITNSYCTSCFEPINGVYAVLTIEDTGEGIDPGKISAIFEPFYTTKDVGKGSGMGLSMVHGITHDHHGHILVHSKLTNGTRFEILFPLNINEIRKTGND